MDFRLATFNVENLFRRVRALNLDSTAATQVILDDVASLTDLLGKVTYAPEDKAAMLALLQQDDVENAAVRDLVAVCGDFNELPSSPSLVPLLGLRGLRNLAEKLPAGQPRWTHRDDATTSKNEQIDYLVVSEPLFAACTAYQIERRGI